MKLITFFFLLFMAAAFGLIFLYFNKWMEEQSGSTFIQEIIEVFVPNKQRR